MSNYLQSLEYYDGGRFFQLPRDFINSLRDGESITLAVIINFARMDITSNKDKDKWVRMTSARIRSWLPSYSVQKIKRILGGLQRKKIIQLELRSRDKTMKRERWVFVDVECLQKWIERHQISPICSGPKPDSQQFINEPSDGSKMNHNYKEQDEKNTVGAEPRPFVIKIHKRIGEDAVWNEYGQQLKNAISKVTTVPKSAKPSQWGAAIRAVHKLDGYPTDQIKTILDWYCNVALPLHGDVNTNGNPGRLPVAYSGKSFRDKFIKLLGAYANHKKQHGTAGSKRKTYTPTPGQPKPTTTSYGDEW